MEGNGLSALRAPDAQVAALDLHRRADLYLAINLALGVASGA
jgi:hypothetical protein